MEEWRIVPIHRLTSRYKMSSDQKYEASSLGRIRRDGIVISSPGSLDTYRQVYVNGRGFGVHRLVALAFLHRSKTKLVVNHKNFKKGDNRPENLEWVTNTEDACHGRRRVPGSAKGMRSPRPPQKHVPYVSAYELHRRYLEEQAQRSES